MREIRNVMLLLYGVIIAFLVFMYAKFAMNLNENISNAITHSLDKASIEGYMTEENKDHLMIDLSKTCEKDSIQIENKEEWAFKNKMLLLDVTYTPKLFPYKERHNCFATKLN